MAAHFLINNADNNVSNIRLSEEIIYDFMEKFLVILSILGYIIPFLFAWAAYNKAKSKHRSPWGWAVICCLSGILGYIVLCCSSELEYDEELETTIESDSLGNIMLLLAFIWFLLTYWIMHSDDFIKFLSH